MISESPACLNCANGFGEASPAAREVHLRQVDGKRPTRAVEELHQVAATRTERRLFAQVDFRHEMRPIAFVDPGAFLGTDRPVASGFPHTPEVCKAATAIRDTPAAPETLAA